MVLVNKLQSDRNRFIKPGPIYYKGLEGYASGGSIYNSLNNRQIYLNKSKGGFIELASIINSGKMVADLVKDNKELILQA
jgi:hypothetical protein